MKTKVWLAYEYILNYGIIVFNDDEYTKSHD